MYITKIVRPQFRINKRFKRITVLSSDNLIKVGAIKIPLRGEYLFPIYIYQHAYLLPQLSYNSAEASSVYKVNVCLCYFVIDT